MLKRLFAKEEADSVLEVGSQSEETVITETAQDDIAPTVAVSSPEPGPKLVRKGARSMRDSDIKDEQGRSAEQIAAEAAKEFDIEAVVRKAASMPDVVVAKPATPQASAPAPVEVPKHSVGPAAASPAAVPVAPSVAPAPVAPKVPVKDGHIALPVLKADVAAKSRQARDAYWARFGESDAELLGYKLSPQLLGQPAWPTPQQRFRLVRTANSLIIASDGLSDPFGNFDARGTGQGFAVEVFIEVIGWQDADAQDVRKSWAFRAVEHAARLIAYAEDLGPRFHGKEILSLDLPSNCVPKGWVEPGVAEPAGALLNVLQPKGAAEIAEMPLGNVRSVALTPIHPEELESCQLEGLMERHALANDLLTTGPGHRMLASRTSLR